MSKVLIIRDDVHGDIQITEPIRHLIDAPLFQRLRHIGQNGLLYLVYPGMRHSRFEHSLGAYHLSNLWFSKLLRVFKDPEYTNKFLPLSEDYKTTDGKILRVKETKKLFGELAKNNSLSDRWKNIVSTSALLHDIGHGPLSHALEHFKLLNPADDFKNYCSTQSIIKFLSDKEKNEEDFEHEDMSLIYCDSLLTSVRPSTKFYSEDGRKNLICAATLIHKDFKKAVLSGKISTHLADEDKNFIRLFSPIISGLFDVDRMDYMKRDSLKAGVKFGVVEIEKLIQGLCPILFEDESKTIGSALIAKSRLVHTMDHFLISLFELYTNVYHHPTNEVIQQQLKMVFENKKIKAKLKLNVEDHQEAVDYNFLEKLNDLTDGLTNQITERAFAEDRFITQVYAKQSTTSNKLKDYRVIVPEDGRPVIKDGIDIWLIDGKDDLQTIQSWKTISMVASKLKSEVYVPSIWWKNKSFSEALNKFLSKKSSSRIKKKVSRKAG